mmetsp:Transcript_13568/g.34841  ORF Transcript_13568/g.34841 Transcript_13568/m.34841 type:complete len:86 (+) Transcript_13568:100-357(+)
MDVCLKPFPSRAWESDVPLPTGLGLVSPAAFGCPAGFKRLGALWLRASSRRESSAGADDELHLTGTGRSIGCSNPPPRCSLSPEA